MAKKNKIISTPEVKPNTNSKSIGFFEFYVRSFVILLFFIVLLWVVVFRNYFDLAEADALSKRMQAGQILSPEESKQLKDVQIFLSSSDYKWFYNYKWVYHNLIVKNLKIQDQLDSLDYDGRQAYKNGHEFNYLKMIRDKTPENAVILMPDQDDLKIPEYAGNNVPQFSLINDKAWAYYFLYPRKLVYDKSDSLDSLGGQKNIRKDPDFKKNRASVTHVAIVYGNGYNKLNYKADSLEAYTVLPINKK